jgi:hypothetical protein
MGNYLKKLITEEVNSSIKKYEKYNKKKNSFKIYNLFNEHSQSKGIPIRF